MRGDKAHSTTVRYGVPGGDLDRAVALINVHEPPVHDQILVDIIVHPWCADQLPRLGFREGTGAAVCVKALVCRADPERRIGG